MNALINISEHNLNVIKRFVGGDGAEELPPRIIEDLIRSAYLGIVLDGLTNGEVFKKVFQKAEVDETNRGYAILKLKSTHNGEPYIADRVSVWNSVWNRKWGE